MVIAANSSKGSQVAATTHSHTRSKLEHLSCAFIHNDFLPVVIWFPGDPSVFTNSASPMNLIGSSWMHTGSGIFGSYVDPTTLETDAKVERRASEKLVDNFIVMLLVLGYLL